MKALKIMKHHQKFVQMNQVYNSTFGFSLKAGYTLELGIIRLGSF